jgi:hypothetical protein
MASVNFAKSFIATVLVALLIVVGYICHLNYSEATRIAARLNAYKAQVQRIQAQGRGNYCSYVVLNVDGKTIPSTLDTKIGEVGSIVTVWSGPKFSFSYTHKNQIQERALRSWATFLLLLLFEIFVFMAMYSKATNKV